jgi:transcriptional regulator with XRE-family HTH domain
VANASGTGQDAVPSRRRTGRSTAEAEGANPTVRQRELGSRLRALRHSLDLTVEDVGAQLECSATKISRIETGARRASIRDVRDLCELYGISGQTQADELMTLARQAREPGWWSRYDDPQLHDAYIGLEQEAAVITNYSMYWVPGLLQTPEYARSIVLAWRRRIEPRALDERVDARMRRQRIMAQPSPPRYRALLDEAVLRRQVGGPAVMSAQLGKILEWAADGQGSVQVIPFTVGGHASVDSNFDLFEFGPDSAQHPVICVESLTGALYYERPADISRYRDAIESLRESALSLPASLDLISQVRESYLRSLRDRLYLAGPASQLRRSR